MEKRIAAISSSHHFRILLLIPVGLLLLQCFLSEAWTPSMVGHPGDFSALTSQCQDLPKVDIGADFWQKNRAHLIRQLNHSKTADSEAVLLFGRTATIGNEGYDFVQDSDFMFVAGIPIASAAILFSPSSATLFLPVRSKQTLEFEGAFPSAEFFKRYHGIDKVLELTDIESTLGPYSTVHVLPTPNVLIPNLPKVSRHDLRAALNRARRSKMEHELEAIEYATAIAAMSHIKVMHDAEAGASEYDLLSTFIKSTMVCGSRVQAYSPIVAAGEHAAVLHFQQVNEDLGNVPIRRGSLVLVDASGAYKGYASDITRTFPVGFWPAYGREIYEIVLAANLGGISMVKEGAIWSTIAKSASMIILDGLKELDIIRGDTEAAFQVGVASVFMPHGLGHTVGLDVHDVDMLPVQLYEHDVVTIEPGIYFSRLIFDAARENLAVAKFINWEIVDRLLDEQLGGVRIEDVVAVTPDGHRVISESIPKSLEYLDRLLASKRLRFFNH